LSEDRKLPSLKDIKKLPKLQQLVMDYFIKYISVGEVVAIIELREQIKALRDPDLVPEFDDVIIEIHISRALADLVEKGFLERAEGVYNLAPQLREELKQRREYKVNQQRSLF